MTVIIDLHIFRDANTLQVEIFGANLIQLRLERTIARTHNSGFKKLALHWLIEHSTPHQHLWWHDSFVI